MQMMDVFYPVQGRWDKSANKPGNRWEKQSHVDKARSTLCDVWESKLWAICFREMRDFFFLREGCKEKTRSERKCRNKKGDRNVVLFVATPVCCYGNRQISFQRQTWGPQIVPGNSVLCMKLRTCGGEEEECLCFLRRMTGLGFPYSCCF